MTTPWEEIAVHELNPAYMGLVGGQTIEEIGYQAWLNVGGESRITYQTPPGRIRFAADASTEGVLERGAMYLPSGGPGVLHLVVTAVEATSSGVVYIDGARAVELDGSTWRVWQGNGGALEAPIVTGEWPIGTPVVLTVVSDGDTTSLYLNGELQGSAPHVLPTADLAMSFAVVEGVWDLHRMQWWTAIPDNLTEQMQALVSEYAPKRSLTAAARLGFTVAATVAEHDPWADVDIPDPEEPGGAVVPPDLPEPVEPPDPDW